MSGLYKKVPGFDNLSASAQKLLLWRWLLAWIIFIEDLVAKGKKLYSPSISKQLEPFVNGLRFLPGRHLTDIRGPQHLIMYLSDDQLQLEDIACIKQMLGPLSRSSISAG